MREALRVTAASQLLSRPPLWEAGTLLSFFLSLLLSFFISSLLPFFCIFLPHLFTSSFTSPVLGILSRSFAVFHHLFSLSLPLWLTITSATPLSLQQSLFSFSPPYHVSHPLFFPPTGPPWRVPLFLSAQPIVACEKKETSKSAVYCSPSGENLFSTARKASQALLINA